MPSVFSHDYKRLQYIQIRFREPPTWSGTSQNKQAPSLMYGKTILSGRCRNNSLKNSCSGQNHIAPSDPGKHNWYIGFHDLNGTEHQIGVFAAGSLCAERLQ
jgi:hypothetical protein